MTDWGRILKHDGPIHVEQLILPLPRLATIDLLNILPPDVLESDALTVIHGAVMNQNVTVIYSYFR
jgi:hypothetical protein